MTLLEETRTEVLPVPPAAPEPPRRPARPPKAPRRPPSAARAYAPLTPAQAYARSSLLLVLLLTLGFVLNVTVLSQLQHLVSQQQLHNDFRAKLADGTAPVSEGDVDDRLLADGTPVALLEIPRLGVHEVIVEGTSAGDLMHGPGHRRDTVLPSQEGTSVILGRAAAYGGPFSRIQELQPGERFSVLTGQGLKYYTVIGVRYAGDPTPPNPTTGHSRLILETARGPAFIPTGVAYVDADLIVPAEPAGTRQTTFASLPPSALAMATDTSTVWALVFALQFLLVVELAAVWTFQRIGGQRLWLVFAPLAILACLLVATQLTYLLPNLL